MSALSNRKGAAFERYVCKSLSLWCSGGERDDIFWRTPMSGGRATIAGTGERSANAGDVCCMRDEGQSFINQYYIECKNMKSLELHRALMKMQGWFVDIFIDTLTCADEYARRPVLICKQLRMPAMVAALQGTWSCLTDDAMPASYQLISIRNETYDITIELYLFDDLLKSNYIN